MIQLTKGAMSRALTVAAGDVPARSTTGESLTHHKWWPRQYVAQSLRDDETLQRGGAAIGAPQLVRLECETARNGRDACCAFRYIAAS